MNTERSNDRREHLRVAVSLSIRFKDFGEFSQFVEGHLKDISRGGVFVRTANPKPLGSEVLLQIPNGDGDYHTIKGIVRSVIRSESAQGNLKPGMGIEFVEVEDEMRVLIDRVIAHHSR